MKHTNRLALLTLGCAMPILGVTGPASAADNVTQESVSFPVETITTCEGGAEVGLGFDLVRNVHTFTDSSGAVVRISRNVNYTGIFALMGTGRTVTFQGTRIVTFDLVAGTFTSVGNYRKVTAPGVGVIFNSAGREVFDANDALVFSSGPKYDEFSDGAQADVCGLFGLDPA